MQQAHYGTVDLAEAAKTLARSRKVAAALRQELGEEDGKLAIALMLTGSLEGDLGDRVHDFLIDAIRNEAKVVWDGEIPGSEFAYPVNVNSYGGVFFVWAMEYDPVGYFLSRSDAVSYIKFNWDGVKGRVCK